MRATETHRDGLHHRHHLSVLGKTVAVLGHRQRCGEWRGQVPEAVSGRVQDRNQRQTPHEAGQQRTELYVGEMQAGEDVQDCAGGADVYRRSEERTQEEGKEINKKKFKEIFPYFFFYIFFYIIYIYFLDYLILYYFIGLYF